MNYESRILAHFKKGRTLTVRQAWRKFSTSELRHYVSLINRRHVHFIDSCWQMKGGKRFKIFWLETVR